MRTALVKLIQVVLLTLGPLVMLISMVQHEQDARVQDDFLEYEPTKSYFTKRDYYFVPHAHDDPGWIFTMRWAQNKFKIQNDGLVEYLTAHPEFKFTFADIVFLFDWEKENPGSIKKFKELIQKGQVEIVNCGMSIPDQVLVHYDDLINVFEYGREYCKHELGVLPVVGWSVDSFGFGSYMSRVFAEMGYTHQVINRLPYLRKKEMKRRKEVFFNWRGINIEDDLPAFISPTHYKTPPPSNQPFPNYDLLDTKFNILDHVRIFMFHLETLSGDFATEKVLIFFGDDFSYDNFTGEAKGYYNLMLSVRSNTAGIFKNSTTKISSFVEFLNDFNTQKVPLSSYGPGDFLPHIDGHQALGDRVWTGYYFLRPSFKFLGKNFGKLYRGMTEQLTWQHLQNMTVSAAEKSKISEAFREAKIKQGLMTHHDAITGTSAHYVIKDYQKLIAQTVKLMSDSVGPSLTSTGTSQYILGKIVELDNSSTVSILAINGAVRSQRQISVRQQKKCPTKGIWNIEATGNVTGSILTDKVIGCQLDMTDRTVFAPFARRVYRVSHSTPEKLKDNNLQTISYSTEKIPFEQEMVYTIGDSLVKATLTTNEISVQILNQGKLTKSFKAGLWTHREWPYNTHDNIKNLVGIYTMRTLNKKPDPVKLSEGRATLTSDSIVLTIEGRSYPATALHVIFEPFSGNRQLRIKVSMDMLILPYLVDFMMRVEFDPVAENSGYDKVFYTDSNGQDIIKRTFDDTDRIERSLYPIASLVSIPTQTADGRFKAVSILVDRPTAATSPKSGIIELGISRNNQGKDNLGVHESGHDLDPTHSEYVVVWEDSTHQDVSKALPSIGIRKSQLQADTEVLVASIKTYDSSLARSGVTSDIEAGEYIQIVGDCPHGKTSTETVRILIDQRIEGIMARVYNLNSDCALLITDMRSFLSLKLGIARPANIEERSIDFNQPAAGICINVPLMPNARRLREIALKESSRSDGYLFKPLKYKTFKLF